MEISKSFSEDRIYLRLATGPGPGQHKTTIKILSACVFIRAGNKFYLFTLCTSIGDRPSQATRYSRLEHSYLFLIIYFLFFIIAFSAMPLGSLGALRWDRYINCQSIRRKRFRFFIFYFTSLSFAFCKLHILFSLICF